MKKNTYKMLLKIDSIKNKHLKRFIEHSTYITIMLVLIPGFLYFELCVVLPNVVEFQTYSYFVHYFCATFLLLNIVSNMIYGMFTNTSVKGHSYLDTLDRQNWVFCTVCECLRPPRAWHCSNCDICILKRDHHCTFFACCVGYFNHRYFMFFTLYIFVAMVYAFYYNILFLSFFIKWNNGLIIGKFIFPLASFVIDYNEETLYVFLVEINFFVAIFTGFLFFYHLINLLQGKITPEIKSSVNDSYDKGMKLNLVEVFGSRWYLAWISPFIKSPLPGSGAEWIVEDKHK